MALSVGILSYKSPISNAYSDPRYDLLVSQAIIEHGTIKLDAYKEHMSMTHHGVYQHDGHVYNFYPLGSSIFSLPIMAIFLKSGKIMFDHSSVSDAQRTLIVIILPLMFLIIYTTGLKYLPPLMSLVITSVTFLGSAMISTMGTALWSHDFGVLFASIIILMLVRYEREDMRPNPYLLGLMLFCAYFSRPTFSILILCTFIYLLMRDKKLLLKSALTSLSLLFLFMVFSYAEYGSILPPYYLGPVPIHCCDELLPTMKDILIAPSRGVLIFSPFLLALLAGAFVAGRPVMRDRLWWLPPAWFVFLTITLSLEVLWWGGGNFGPRRFVDAFPSAALFGFIVAEKLRHATSRATATRFVYACFLVLGAISIWINTKQGLYNGWAAFYWNEDPTVSKATVTDWRYPQFLYDEQRHYQRLFDFYAIKPLPVDRPLSVEPGDYFLYFNWSPYKAPSVRTSTGSQPFILFSLDRSQLTHTPLYLEIGLKSIEAQTVDLYMNSSKLGSLDLAPDESKGITIKILKNKNINDGANKVQFILEKGKHIEIIGYELKSRRADESGSGSDLGKQDIR